MSGAASIHIFGDNDKDSKIEPVLTFMKQKELKVLALEGLPRGPIDAEMAKSFLATDAEARRGCEATQRELVELALELKLVPTDSEARSVLVQSAADTLDNLRWVVTFLSGAYSHGIRYLPGAIAQGLEVHGLEDMPLYVNANRWSAYGEVCQAARLLGILRASADPTVRQVLSVLERIPTGATPEDASTKTANEWKAAAVDARDVQRPRLFYEYVRNMPEVVVVCGADHVEAIVTSAAKEGKEAAVVRAR